MPASSKTINFKVRIPKKVKSTYSRKEIRSAVLAVKDGKRSTNGKAPVFSRS
jgi:hypothetical protein